MRLGRFIIIIFLLTIFIGCQDDEQDPVVQNTYVFPNPFMDTVTIVTKFLDLPDKEVSVCAVNYRLFNNTNDLILNLDTAVSCGIGEFKKTVVLNSIPEGVYILEVRAEEMSDKVKIFKQWKPFY